MTAEDLQRGRLEQECPDCGRREAAGSYCTKCFRPMGESDWRRAERSPAQKAALAGVRRGVTKTPDAGVRAKKSATP